MAHKSRAYLAAMADSLTCPICMSIFTSPVTLTCGHVFCFSCITASTDHRCPLCRDRFVQSAFIPAYGINDLCQVFFQERKASKVCTFCTSGRPSIGACKGCAHALCSVCASASCDEGDGNSNHDVEKRKQEQEVKVYSCPLHEGEHASYVCIQCQHPACSSCNQELVHDSHVDEVIARIDLPRFLADKMGELKHAIAPVCRMESGAKEKRRVLSVKVELMREDIESSFHSMVTRVVGMLAKAKEEALATVETSVLQGYKDRISLQQKRAEKYKQIYDLFRRIPVNQENLLSLLKKGADLSKLIREMEEDCRLIGLEKVTYSLPDLSDVLHMFEEHLNANNIDFQLTTMQCSTNPPDFPVDLRAENAAYCLGSPHIRLIATLGEDMTWRSLGCAQIALHNKLIYLASSTGLMQLDCMTNTLSTFSPKNTLRQTLRGKFKPGGIKNVNAVFLNRLSNGNTILCLAPIYTVEKNDVVELLEIDRKGYLLRLYELTTCNSIGLCLRGKSLYVIERDSLNLYKEEYGAERRLLGVVPCKVNHVLMTYDVKHDCIWIRSGYAELIQMSNDGSLVTWEVKECSLITGLAVDDNGFLWLTDSGRARLFAYGVAETRLRLMVEINGNRELEFHLPSSVSIDGDDVVVMDKRDDGRVIFFVYRGLRSFSEGLSWLKT